MARGPDRAPGDPEAFSATAGWFADNGAGGYITPDGSSSQLTHVSAGGWILTHKDGGRNEFDADGLITARVDRNGNRTTYDYIDGDGDGDGEGTRKGDGGNIDLC